MWFFVLCFLIFFLMDEYNHNFSFVASIMVSYKFSFIIKQFKAGLLPDAMSYHSNTTAS